MCFGKVADITTTCFNISNTSPNIVGLVYSIPKRIVYRKRLWQTQPLYEKLISS